MPLEDRAGRQATETDVGGWKDEVDADNDRCTSLPESVKEQDHFFFFVPFPDSNENL